MAKSIKQQYKIILIGDGGVGKTTFIQRYIAGSFRREYLATIGAEVHHIAVRLNNDIVLTFVLWDIAGQEQHSHLDDAYYLNADGCIVMFDLTSRITAKNVNPWIRKVRNIDPENKIPIICCGNKADSKQRMPLSRFINLIPSGIKYEDISVKSNLKIDAPLVWLAEQFTGLSNVQLEANIMQPEINIDEESYRMSMETANVINNKDAMDAASKPFMMDDDEEKDK